MNAKITKQFILLMANIVLSVNLFASSGETEYIINGSGQYICTRSLWANNYAPLGMGCLQFGGTYGDGANNDLESGAVFNPDVAFGATGTILNGFFVNHNIFLAAKLQGSHGVLHHERNWAQHQAMNSGNEFDEALILSVDEANNKVTVKFYTNLPSSCVFYNDSVFNYSASAIMKYEGIAGTESEVLQPGRHLRIYKERPQLVFAFTPAAFQYERSVWNGNYYGWVRKGIFRGEYGSETYFAEYRNGGWVNAYTIGVGRDVDGYKLVPEADYACARPGDQIVIVPRMTSLTSYNATYSQYLPADDGSVIGYIIAVAANQATVRVEKSVTGKAEDVTTEDIVVNLDADAEYHINGIKGGLKTDAIQIGNFVRILPNISNGMLLTRDVGTAGQNRQTLAIKPVPHAVIPTNQNQELTLANSWKHIDTIWATENETKQLTLWIYNPAGTLIEWFRNGVAVPGTKSTLTEIYSFQSIYEYCNLSDNGAVFTMKATTAAGTVSSSPIVLMVAADASPLMLGSVGIGDKNTIQLSFNKWVQPGIGTNGAENLSNYSIDNGISISGITLIGDRKTVIINTSDLTSGNDYVITVNNVQDMSETPNIIANNSQITASFTVKFRFFRFAIKGKGSLSPRVEEMRYITKGISYGVGKSYFGHVESYKAFDNNSSSYLQPAVGDYIGLDMGIGYEILPDTLMINASGGSGRNIYGFTVEGSNDQAVWTMLMDRNDTILGVNTFNYYFKFDNSGLDPTSILVGAKQAQTITFPAITDKDISESPVTLTAIASSGLTVTYYIISGPATVTGNMLTLKDTGTVWIQATQSGNENYYSAYPIDRTFNVSISGKLNQSISFSDIPDKLQSDAPFDLVASATSGLSVSFTVLSGPANISGYSVSLTGDTGTVVIEATQAGSSIYNPAPAVQKSFKVTIVTAMNDNYNNNKISFYPNPARDVIHFSSADVSLVRIINILGTIVAELNPQGQSLNISGLDAGIYMLQITNTAGQLSTLRLMKK